MRSVRLLALLLGFIFVPLSLQTQTGSDPTLEETAAWLSSNLVGVREAHQRTQEFIDPKTHAPRQKSRMVYRYDTVILQAHLEHCQLTVVERENRTAPNWNGIETRSYTVPLDRIQTVEIMTVDRSKNSEVRNSVITYEPAT